MDDAPAGDHGRPTDAARGQGELWASMRWWVLDRWGASVSGYRVVASLAVALAGVAMAGFVVGARVATPPAPDLPMVGGSSGLPMVTTTAAAPIHVHVAGAVARPGLYMVAPRSRVADLVAAAGGPGTDADLDRLNLAAPVSDGDRVEVPRIGRPLVGEVAPSGVASSEVVDVNRAGASELEQLPGIGPGLAAAIVADRDEHGPFAGVDDLDRVPGIGPATLERLRSRARA